MRRFHLIKYLHTLVLVCLLVGCSTPVPLWRQDALSLLERVRVQHGQQILPAEYESIEDLVLRGDALVRKNEVEAADKLFLLAWSKANLLEKNLLLEKRRLAEEKLRKEHAERLEAERKRAMEEESRKQAEQKSAEEKAARAAETRRLTEKAERTKQARERQSPTYHTVKRGESLPFIASQPEVYNDRNLWPLLYRANRDQISNPKHLWPGQVLRIPRNSSREDIAEARKYAQDRPLH